MLIVKVYVKYKGPQDGSIVPSPRSSWWWTALLPGAACGLLRAPAPPSPLREGRGPESGAHRRVGSSAPQPLPPPQRGARSWIWGSPSPPLLLQCVRLCPQAVSCFAWSRTACVLGMGRHSPRPVSGRRVERSSAFGGRRPSATVQWSACLPMPTFGFPGVC